ncbi:MAG: EamA family transporter [Candidatus Omnitrophica bacterium]|nr:EamA family transporter [Candidatus Omnitrophota bacterium]
MQSKRHLTLGIFLLLASTDLLETLVQFCFKKCALAQAGVVVSTFSQGVAFAGAVLLSPYLWFGLATVFVLFAIWAGVLSRIDLSVAVPVASLSYITIPLVSIIFLHEAVSLLRWIGIAFIIIGVIMVSLSSKEISGAKI